MRVPLAWLHEHCRPDLSVEALVARLDLTGTAVERVVHHGVGDPAGFVVGKVLAVEPHPDADRLRVCRVDVGEAEPAQIVCGAPNVAAGQTVPVARPGAVMPDGTRLKKAKLRGVASEGMVLAEDELAIGTDHDGILVLEDDGLRPGAPLAGVLPIATEVLELELTPNRPDQLGLYGNAREVHAVTGAPLGPPPWADDPGAAGPAGPVLDGFPARVTVEAEDLCPRFTARVFEDVRVGPSPPWLKARLMACGQRPISNVVDITNYVMLLTAQPLHAFDLDRVAGGHLIVRRAHEGEELVTLDDQRRVFDAETVLVCDEDGPGGIGGIMGGARSEVHEGTTRVLMEAATWVGPNIHRSSLRLGLRTEASSRFEKGLPPEAALEAQAVAARLMVELCGARLVPGTIDVGGPGPAAARLRLRDARLTALLGLSVPRERQRAALGALGFGVEGADDGLDVLVPPHRRLDVTREADVIEEVARLEVLDRLPSTLPRSAEAGRLTVAQRLRRRAEDALAGMGLHEIAGWSFTPPDLADRLLLPADDPRRAAIRLANPMSEAEALLRTTLAGSLLDAARHNVARGARDVRLFESGAVYLGRGPDELPDEPHRLGGLLVGAARDAGWREAEPPSVDVFAAKGVLEGLLGALRVGWRAEAAAEPFLHPGRAAAVVLEDGTRAGWLGELHPRVAAAWDLPNGAGFELDLAPVLALAGRLPLYADLTSFPSVRQDLAVVVPEDVPAGRVLDVARAAGGPTLAGAEVFDVYRGAQAGAGMVSLALRLEFRAGDRTLTDEEASAARERIAGALADEVGARARG